MNTTTDRQKAMDDFFYTNDDGKPFDNIEQAENHICDSSNYGELVLFKMGNCEYIAKVDKSNAWQPNPTDYSYYLTGIKEIGRTDSPLPTVEGEQEMKRRDIEIIKAYCRIRTIDNTIPDDILEFMKDSALYHDDLYNALKELAAEYLLHNPGLEGDTAFLSTTYENALKALIKANPNYKP